jgi:hypothetical protein
MLGLILGGRQKGPSDRGFVRSFKLQKKRDGDGGLAETAPHYHGHRERLRGRFRDAGPDALSDYELLELLLFPGAAATRRQAARQKFAG